MARPLALLVAVSAHLAWTAQVPLANGGVAFYDPGDHGGSMLDNAGDGLGEPLNVIISGLSSPEVLTYDGLINYARAIDFSTECFNIHLGNPMTADLGDGRGPTNQTVELRQDYDNAGVGTCLESLVGGNHFRVWQQNGSLANSGAMFLAVSKEEPATENHDIIPDGYNLGRDALVASAVGNRTRHGVKYQTTAVDVTGLMPAGSTGINHGIAVDGIVSVLTVRIAE
ncbi:hypothetical protein K488DRAFT_76652 [Vararia minispora EC-137]|uniref:Uncharacterized protein n=1 Tax=Vararia minispora EC-137 TaxID=1314806 RepID=A0ACB8QUS0_9AGAM|nr:hypothetical protein K488DRAFT_76652 [Vararia minispora EC-137]